MSTEEGTEQQGGAAGKKKQPVQLSEEEEELNDLIEQHQYHASKIEIIVRMLDNKSLTPERVEEIKDDIEYYVSDCNEPEDADSSSRACSTWYGERWGDVGERWLRQGVSNATAPAWVRGGAVATTSESTTTSDIATPSEAVVAATTACVGSEPPLRVLSVCGGAHT